MTDDTSPQQVLDAALQSLAPGAAQALQAPSTVCTSWVVVAEWSGSNGQQTLTRHWSDSTPKWRRDGMMHEALYGDWANLDGPDDDCV